MVDSPLPPVPQAILGESKVQLKLYIACLFVTGITEAFKADKNPEKINLGMSISHSLHSYYVYSHAVTRRGRVP